MTELVKARLGEIGSGNGPQEGSNWVDVQFNPTSLRITRSNNIDRAGVTTKTQKVQNPSSEAAKPIVQYTWDGETATGMIERSRAS